MTVLVSGGAGSGKSAYAEELLCTLGGKARRVYLATMRPWGQEAEARILRHRRQRARRGFLTVERYVDLAAWTPPPDSAVLLEDLGNLCANELFDPEGSGEVLAVLRGVEQLQNRCPCLVLVSNEVGGDGCLYPQESRRYQEALAWLNRRLARRAEAVCEVSGGLPLYYKGGEAIPWSF